MATTEAPPRENTPGPARSPKRRWTRGTITLLATGVVSMAVGAGMLAGAGVLNAVDNHARDGDYLTTDTTQLDAAGHALAIEEIDLDGLSGDWLGKARVRVATSDPDTQLFVGVAQSDDAAAYLSGVRYSTVDEIDDPQTRYAEHAGGAPSIAPAASDIWIAQASGAGTQSLHWTPKSGDWTVVVMNSDGSAGVHVTADAGATVPLLERATYGLLASGVVLVLAGAGLVLLVVRRMKRTA